MDKYFMLLCCVFSAITLKAQFKKGDVVVNVNYGAPNIAAWSERKNFGSSSDEFFYRSVVDYSKSTGVRSARAEYAINDRLSLGLSSGYWHMDFAHSYTYTEHVMANTGAKHSGTYKYHLSSTSIAVRANYHFWNNKVIYAYTGIGLGITKHVSNYQYFQDVGSALGPHTFISGTSPCIALTVGARYYPVSFFGFNLEAGYDTGALLLGGIVFKINTKNEQLYKEKQK